MASHASGQQLSGSKAPSSTPGKNGSVEFLRFLFTSVIILFHINLDLWDQGKVAAVVGGVPVAFFHHGNLGVEFFFLVTGFLMAGSVRKEISGGRGQAIPLRGPSTGKGSPAFSPRELSPRELSPRAISARDDLRLLPGRTIRFLTHKINSLFPYYLPACLLTPLVRLLTGRTLNKEYFLQRIPSLFFLQRLGLGRPIIGCTWYLSSMLIALAFAYPLCRLFYRAYTHVAGPVLCAVILCALVFYTGSLGDIEDWFLFTYKTNFRAFAEISMGAAGFELTRLLSGRTYSPLARVLLSAAAIISLALSAAYICSFAANIWSLPVFLLLFIAVVITFSGEGALSRTGVFSHPFFLYLGSISLPMYVSQTLMRMYVPWQFSACSPEVQCFLIYSGVLLLGAVMHAAVTRAQNIVKDRRPAHSLAHKAHSGRLFPFTHLFS